ncbi:MAG: hypothetical protein ACLT98_01815 [Eggerthellaceae bacterium]
MLIVLMFNLAGNVFPGDVFRIGQVIRAFGGCVAERVRCGGRVLVWASRRGNWPVLLVKAKRAVPPQLGGPCFLGSMRRHAPFRVDLMSPASSR